MKIQELAIIFILIILPISLVLSEYTQFQVQTLKTQTVYDSKLTAATYDAIKAFQLNATNSTESSLVNAEMRDITASVNTFRNSLMSTFKLNGYTEEELNNYIPALVYTLYDGFYIYSPYQNENHRYLNTGTGESLTDKEKKTGYVETDGNGEKLYGIKPYISYSCRYKREPSIDVVITYSLDNYITVQGMIDEKYVNKSGYLIDNIEIKTTGEAEEVLYNGIKIESETLKEYVPIKEYEPIHDHKNNYQYAKITGIKYYLIPDYISEAGTTKDCIVYIFNGTPIIQAKEGDSDFEIYKGWIEKNRSAIQYYKDAKTFTDWFIGKGLAELEYADAYDEVISNNGTITIDRVWGADDDRKIFKDPDNMIESELSNFNQHRLAVIRHKIEVNLAIAISNYNEYSGVSNVFQMPKLKEEEWEYIIHNISLISFLQGLPIGGKTYNGYSIVTNSESDKVVLEDNIYILTRDASGAKIYRRIGDNDIETGNANIDAGEYSTYEAKKVISAGRLNLDFERSKVIINGDGDMKYYYPLKSYNASYNSIVMQDKVTTYDDIYKFVNSSANNDLKTAFYTALGRERASMYITKDDIK